MKIKRFFESNSDKPQVGDYVVCSFTINSSKEREKELNKAIENKIGQIKIIDFSSSKFPYQIEFDKYEGVLRSVVSMSNGFVSFRRDEIKFFSKNKEDLEIYLVANKYNL